MAKMACSSRLAIVMRWHQSWRGCWQLRNSLNRLPRRHINLSARILLAKKLLAKSRYFIKKHWCADKLNKTTSGGALVSLFIRLATKITTIDLSGVLVASLQIRDIREGANKRALTDRQQRLIIIE